MKRLELATAMLAKPMQKEDTAVGKKVNNQFYCWFCDSIKNMQYFVINLNIKEFYSLIQMRDSFYGGKTKKEKKRIMPF